MFGEISLVSKIIFSSLSHFMVLQITLNAKASWQLGHIMAIRSKSFSVTQLTTKNARKTEENIRLLTA